MRIGVLLENSRKKNRSHIYIIKLHFSVLYLQNIRSLVVCRVCERARVYVCACVRACVCVCVCVNVSSPLIFLFFVLRHMRIMYVFTKSLPKDQPSVLDAQQDRLIK